MSRTKCVVCLLAFAGGTAGSLFFSLHNSTRKPSADFIARRLAAERARENFSVPAVFEANVGQFPASVDLAARQFGAEQFAEKRRFLGGRSFSSDIKGLFTRRALAPEDLPSTFSASSERARRNFSVPALFEANEGQFPANVDFAGRGKGLSVELNGDGIAFAPANGPATNETVQMRLVREAEPATKWKKVPQNGTSKHGGGIKRGQHESGWHNRQRPKDWKNLRNQRSEERRVG